MDLSVTGYNLFTASQEKFRIVYKALGTGIVPIETPEAMARGTSLHLFMEGHFKGWTRDQIVDLLTEQGVHEEEIERGEKMFPALRDYLDSLQLEVLGVEAEFAIPLQGKLGQHRLVGKIDLIASQGGQVSVKEYKGTNTRKTTAQVEKEFRAAMQVATEIAGARSLGFDAMGMEVIHVVEADVPSILGKHGHLESRTQYQIDYMLRSFAQKADQITMMEKEWGVDEPWAHDIHTIWDTDQIGSCNNGKCEYADICGTVHFTMPDGFKEKPEHLSVVEKI